MIKASIRNKNMILLGLTEGNITRLKNGQPIHATFRSCGLKIAGSVGILYGQNEYDIEAQLRNAALIDDQTKMTFDQQ